MPAEGEPAIVGSWCRLARREASDCLFIELTVDAVTREEVVDVRVTVGGLLEVGLGAAGLRLATRCAVAGGMADICIGGNGTSLDFLCSVEESVCDGNKVRST